MTTADLTNFVEQRPFIPFTLMLANGREVHVPHNEFITTGNAVQSVYVVLPTGQLEVIDAGLIVSIRTFHAAQLPTF
jgi:hypothetical protein